MAAQKDKYLYTTRNRVEIIRGGADYFRRVEEIADRAQYSLHLHTYIFDEDETGTRIAEALIRAARRNVLVYMLLDGYASQHLSKKFIAWLRGSGVHLSFFMPVFKSSTFYIGRRLHHKVVVADGHWCMVTGVNISNRYNDIGDIKGWLDWAVYAEGEIARKLDDICIRTWNRSAFRRKCLATNNPLNIPLPEELCLVRVRVNDWVFKRTEITKTYRELFATAHKQVTLMTSYFWPPRKLLVRMAKATGRGVKVRLILTETADVPFVKYAERYLYRWLLRHNIEIYEYRQNILHGKIAVCDNEFVTAGSYNVNNISAFASVELNLDIKDATVATWVNDRFDEITANDCTQIDKKNFWTSRNIFSRFGFFLSYHLVHFVFFLFTFYHTQRREEG